MQNNSCAGQLSHIHELSVEKSQRLIHELEVHQIELEMQNEELRQAQQELEAARDRYADLYDIAPIGYITVGKDGLILEANLTAAGLLGIDRGDLVHQTLSRFITLQSQDAWYLHYRQVMRDATSQSIELQLQRPDGATFDAQLESIATLDDQGNRHQCRTTLCDITARKRMEEALRLSHETLEQQVQERSTKLTENNRKLRTEIAERKRSEESLQATQARLKLAVHAANVGLWDWDLRTNQVYLSPEWKYQLGYEDHEIENIFGEWESRLHPDDHDRMLATVQSYIKHPWPNYEVDFRLRHKDGSYRWILTHASLIQDTEGKPYRMLGSHVDITERKRTEEALRLSHETLEQQVQERTAELAASNKKLRTEIAERKRAEETLRESEGRVRLLMDSTAEGIYGLDLNGVCTSCNSAALRLLGYHRVDDVLGKNMHELLHHTRPDGSPYPLTECPICKAFKPAERKHVVEEVLSRSDNTSFPAEYWSYPIHQNGRLVGAVVTFLDITERKQAEKALQKARQEADRANAAKSRFLAAASHDLRQPLQTLSLLVGVLKETVKVQEPVKEVIDNLGETLVFMGNLLDILLDINRLESGRIIPHTTDFSVGKFFNRLKARFERQVKNKGLELHVAPCRATLRSDEVLLERIVQNILTNAIRYTTTGKVLLGCRRRGPNLRIEVWDTGLGIPEEQREMIFTDYYQLNNPARNRQKGLGLGLAIVDRVARLLGHRVDFRSTVGKGSVFAVEVPFGAAEPGPQLGPKMEQTGHVEPPKITIVLIEDDQAVLEGMRLFLEIAGFQVITAKTSRDAIAQFEGEPLGVTLIISDYHLSQGETGTQAIQQFREASDQPLPAILLTGDTTPELLHETEICGCQLLHKPVDGDKLITLINQIASSDTLGGIMDIGVGT